VFTASSALCGAAPSLLSLVIFRAVQGVGGAMMMAISPAMTTRAFPSNERGRALGIIAAIVAVGTSTGPALGGIITGALTWRWIFYINIPVGVIGVFATLRFLPEKMRFDRAGQRFDLMGAILLWAGLTSLMLGMTFGQEAGWDSVTIVGLFSASVVLLILFGIVEKRVSQPIVDLSLFRIRLFAASLASSFLSFMALFAVVFLMPFYLEELRGFAPDHAGLLLTAVPLTIGLVAPVSGYLSDIFGSRVLSSLGLAIGSAGLWFLGNLTPQTSIRGIIWPLVIAGLGQAIFQSPNNNAIMGSVPPNRLGTASGFLATVRVLGQGFSVAIAGAIFTSCGGARAGVVLSQRSAADPAPLQNIFIHAHHMAMLVCMCIAAIGVFTSLMRGHAR
jgi:EmrB/QacA subfamily drug resistance transporter